MNVDNYKIFVESLKSVLENRLYHIQLILVDNTGGFLEVNKEENPFTRIRTVKTKEPLLLQFEHCLDFEKDEVKILMNDEVKSVAANWNLIYENASAPVIIYCNDDILVNQYYDKLLYDEVFGKNGGASVYSFPEAYPAKELVDLPRNYDSCRGEYLALRGVKPTIPGFNGACFGVRKSMLEHIASKQPANKPFDERYKLACYEDLDFYKVATSLGHYFLMCFESFIFHYGASTRNSDMINELQDKYTDGEYHIDYNRKEFLKKFDMSKKELVDFEAGLYKGWNDSKLNHPVWHKAQDLQKEKA